jgi:hypothetical protein
MSEFNNISTITLKNENSFSKQNPQTNIVKINNVKLTKKMEIIPEQNENEYKASDCHTDAATYGFTIDAVGLEKIISKYKERGSEYLDLKYFEEMEDQRVFLKH